MASGDDHATMTTTVGGKKKTGNDRREDLGDFDSGERYRVLGMSEVIRVLDLKRNRYLAMKVFRARLEQAAPPRSFSLGGLGDRTAAAFRHRAGSRLRRSARLAGRVHDGRGGGRTFSEIVLEVHQVSVGGHWWTTASEWSFR
jgi:hypothetical protein